ncbi:MAG: PilZ domain-containing protein [Magnetococcales bacterium]|nr:PilZ domain-containing protein [Magnetococcales bacterium]
MSEQEETQYGNELFAVYGALVERLLRAETSPDGASLFPVPDSPVTRDGVALHPHGDAVAAERLLKTLEQLRELLRQEGMDAAAAAGRDDPGTGVLGSQFRYFLKSLKDRDESNLEGNPFYELARALFRYNTGALLNHFVHLQAESLDHPPQPVDTARSYRAIWGTWHGPADLLPKLWETLGKWQHAWKLLLGMLLFCGSTLTTAKGVNDLLQTPELEKMWGGIFYDMEGEGARMLASMFCGLFLSAAILDFKGRLFRGMVETGRIFKGLRLAFRWNPRWIILAVFLTMISIKTNYDGIVLIISKKEDLATQSARIKAQVTKALGDPLGPKPDVPGSLSDLDRALVDQTRVMIEKFSRVPDDEVLGVASSGDPRKGPRYWGKYFVVFGGFQPGANDVVRANKETELSRNIDRLLVTSGLDLRTSLENKIRLLEKRYSDHLNMTRREVAMLLHQLEMIMRMDGFSLQEALRVFSLESYHVNFKVRTIVQLLQANKQIYQGVAQELEQLAEAHVAVLRLVDKAGSASRNEYEINTKVAIPEIEAIDELRRGEISMAEHRSLMELKASLMTSYGAVVGSSILTMILVLAVAMDLADPFVYALMIARTGRRDRSLFNGYIRLAERWREDFSSGINKFLENQQVACVMRGLIPPNRTGILETVLRLFEQANPQAVDDRDQHVFNKVRYWFFGLFTAVRTQEMQGYNARAVAIQRIVSHPEVWFARLIKVLFPGLDPRKGIGERSFAMLSAQVNEAQRRNREVFLAQLSAIKDQRYQASLGRIATAFGASRGAAGGGVLPGPVAVRWQRLRSLLERVFLHPLEEPPIAFAYSRREWLQRIQKRVSDFGENIDVIYEKVPIIKELLFEVLPAFQDRALAPVERMLSTSPSPGTLENLLQLPAMKQELDIIQARIMSIWGIAQFKGSEMDEDVMRSLSVDKDMIDDMAAQLVAGPDSQTRLHGRVAELEQELLRALELGRPLIKIQELLTTVIPRIRSRQMDPIRASLDRFPESFVIQKAAGLKEVQREFDILEASLDAIWQLAVRQAETCARDGCRPARTFWTDLVARVDGLTPDGQGFAGLERRIVELEQRLDKVRIGLEAMESGAREMAAMVTELTEAHDEMKRLLVKINFREVELRSRLLPSRDKLEVLKEGKPFLDAVPDMLNDFMGLLNDFRQGRLTLEEKNLSILTETRSRVRLIQGRLQEYFQAIDKPHTDLVGVAPGGARAPAAGSMEPRRISTRLSHVVPVRFETGDGMVIRGDSRDFGQGGMRFEMAGQAQPPPIGTLGTLVLQSENGDLPFRSKVVRVFGNQVAVQPVEDVERFRTLIQREVFEAGDAPEVEGPTRAALPAPAVALPAMPGPVVPRGALSSGPVDGRDAMTELQGNCGAITQMILNIRMRKLSYRKMRLPPQRQMEVLLRNQSLILEIERRVAVLNQPPDGEEDLRRRLDESRLLLSRIGAIWQQVDTPALIDRRDSVPEAAPAPVAPTPVAPVPALRTPAAAVPRGPSRRAAERQPLATRVALAVGQAPPVEGTTRDIGSGGLNLVLDALPPGARLGQVGRIRFVSDGHERTVSCKLVRLDGDKVGLQVLPGQEAALEGLAREDLLRGLQARLGGREVPTV